MARVVRGAGGLAGMILGREGSSSDGLLNARQLAQVESLVTRLGDLKGLPMKLGQMMSYLDLEMPEEARRLLAHLQRQSSRTPLSQVHEAICADLGDRAPALLARLDPSPISIASIGQVHRARLPDGNEVAVKVRHPDIDSAIRSDFRLARLGSGIAGLVLPGMGATARDFVVEMRTRLLEECDYRLEAERQRRFGEIFAGHPVISVPRVYDAWCGTRVLTTAWQTGRDFESFRASANQAERDRVGAALFDFYVGTLYRHGLFHADPHPGNYELTDDGRVVVFDYGCVRIFEPVVVRAIGVLADAVQADDRRQILQALRSLGSEPSENDAAYAHLRSLLRSFFAPMLRTGAHPVDGKVVIDFERLTRDKLALARLRLPGELVFLLRIRFGLYAVLSRLGAICDWATMERSFERM